jgi:hypothetical protein
VSLEAAIAGAASEASEPQGTARLAWLTGAVAVCPVRVRPAPRVALAPCGGVESGALRVAGGSVPNAETETRPWLAAGAVGRIEVAAAEHLELALEGGARAPILRDTFFFRPATDVYRPPAVLGSVTFAASAHFR